MTQGQDMPKGPWIDDIMFLSADTSKHIWEIKNWRFFSYKCPPLEKNCFWKLFFFQVGDSIKEKNLQFWISKWFEIYKPNFHWLYTSIRTCFVENLKALGASNLNFPTKTSETSNGHGRPIFWATPSKFEANLFLSNWNKC